MGLWRAWRFILDYPGLTPVGVVSQIEPFTGLDDECQLLTTADRHADIRCKSVVTFHPLLKDRFPVGQHLKDTIPFPLGLAIQTNGGDERVPLPLGRENDLRPSMHSQTFVIEHRSDL